MPFASSVDTEEWRAASNVITVRNPPLLFLCMYDLKNRFVVVPPHKITWWNIRASIKYVSNIIIEFSQLLLIFEIGQNLCPYKLILKAYKYIRKMEKGESENLCNSMWIMVSAQKPWMGEYWGASISTNFTKPVCKYKGGEFAFSWFVGGAVYSAFLSPPVHVLFFKIVDETYNVWWWLLCTSFGVCGQDNKEEIKVFMKQLFLEKKRELCRYCWEKRKHNNDCMWV